ncbi:hypothetical protein HNY73_013706 [Argiope bruennichi]|uniref:Uncharacterized protein n=1 Tax=Argiope bruennichi TaxID=94029 RepID=A0A8T0EXI1_ARGBR|nr:hypothetical protein HNY73_013706 [Argiope bruennichi]
MLLLKSINNTTPSGMDARRFKRLTLKLYEESGVPIEPCGQNEIKQFEEFLDVQVHISAEHFNKVIHKGVEKTQTLFAAL